MEMYYVRIRRAFLPCECSCGCVTAAQADAIAEGSTKLYSTIFQKSSSSWLLSCGSTSMKKMMTMMMVMLVVMVMVMMMRTLTMMEC